ncbi:MAG: GntR family transcriptional regulator [Lachnospiraceae bacterium]|nr:GntR family transcriptional regulator [Lachnospiraceae bacterium]
MIILDYKDTRPIYEQIVDKLQKLILSGALTPDQKMPSVRSLAMELSINPNTVQRAYEELLRGGFLYTIKGRGNFVSYNDSLSSLKKEEYVRQMRSILKEASEIGISRDEILEELMKGEKQ